MQDILKTCFPWFCATLYRPKVYNLKVAREALIRISIRNTPRNIDRVNKIGGIRPSLISHFTKSELSPVTSLIRF